MIIDYVLLELIINENLSIRKFYLEAVLNTKGILFKNSYKY